MRRYPDKRRRKFSLSLFISPSVLRRIPEKRLKNHYTIFTEELLSKWPNRISEKRRKITSRLERDLLSVIFSFSLAREGDYINARRQANPHSNRFLLTRAFDHRCSRREDILLKKLFWLCSFVFNQTTTTMSAESYDENLSLSLSSRVNRLFFGFV